jgi:hypothetical protein
MTKLTADVSSRLMTEEEKASVRRAGPFLLKIAASGFGSLGALLVAVVYYMEAENFGSWFANAPYTPAENFVSNVIAAMLCGVIVAGTIGGIGLVFGLRQRRTVQPILLVGKVWHLSGRPIGMLGGKGSNLWQIGPIRFDVARQSFGFPPGTLHASVDLVTTEPLDSAAKGRGWLVAIDGKSLARVSWVSWRRKGDPPADLTRKGF